MSGGSPQWTDSQLRAIRHADGALLVSAAAGSGKTAVLSARCTHLVCDAPEPCDVDELLVLTFTRAAASEMRERIDGTLRKRIGSATASERLLRQLRLIDRAQITTLDGFCGSIVRSHFYQVGVDPGFGMLAPEDANLLKNDVCETLLDGEYDGPHAAVFKQLLDGYFGSDDARLRQQVIQAHALIQSIVDPQQFVIDSLDRLREGATAGESRLLRQFAAIQQRHLKSAVRKLNQIAERARLMPALTKYAAHCDELVVEFDDRLMMCERLDFDGLYARGGGYALPRLPTVPKETPGKEAMQREVDRVKKLIREGAVAKLCRWTREQLRADLARIVPLAEYFFGLVGRYGVVYDAAKRDLRALDFADTETLALRILLKEKEGDRLIPTAAALELQQRFKHVLVDEYQDINPLQNAILRLVSRDAAAEIEEMRCRSNFFAVGDVKQSIYRFRLAEPQQFIERHGRLRKSGCTLGTVIDLQENFRSRGPLLEAVNDVFRLLMTHESAGIAYDETHELRTLGSYPDVGLPMLGGKPIELHVLPREAPIRSDDDAGDEEEADSFEREIALVARRIRELVCVDEARRPRVAVKTPDGVVGRPLQHGDIAVLLRSAKFKSSIVADELRSRGIPVHSDDATGFFNATEVQDVLALLRVLSNLRQDIPLAAVIRSPIANLQRPIDALAAIRIAYPDEPFHRAVSLYASGRDDAIAAELRTLLERLSGWRQMLQERSVADALTRIFGETHYPTFCRALPDGPQRVANLEELVGRAQVFDTFERQGLDRFLQFLHELEANDELGRPAVTSDSTDHVRVMTVHKSKGLEFPVVIVPDLGKRFNERSLADPILLDRDLGIGMSAVDLHKRIRYPSASSTVIKDHARRQALAEEIRVLYVALTRAREHLILVGSLDDHDAAASWRADWADHRGPLPDDVVQAARTPLDWIGPIAAITEARGLGTFAIRTADDAGEDGEVEGCDTPDPQERLREWLASVADTTAVTDVAAQQAIARLTFEYGYPEAARHRSTTRVTDYVTEPLSGTPHVRAGPSPAGSLDWPEAYRKSSAPRAADIGSATHQLLQFLDFRRPLTREDVAAQIADLVARRLLGEREAAMVDVEAIVWLGTTPLVATVRDRDTRLVREQSVAASLQIPGGAEDDLVLVRGRLDLLLDRPDGLTLVDFKTDRVDATSAHDRARVYEPQMAGYADAIRLATRRTVARCCLVFLSARTVVEISIAAEPS